MRILRPLTTLMLLVVLSLPVISCMPSMGTPLSLCNKSVR